LHQEFIFAYLFFGITECGNSDFFLNFSGCWTKYFIRFKDLKYIFAVGGLWHHKSSYRQNFFLQNYPTQMFTFLLNVKTAPQVQLILATAPHVQLILATAPRVQFICEKFFSEKSCSLISTCFITRAAQAVGTMQAVHLTEIRFS
jgi:hypothetical protein